MTADQFNAYGVRQAFNVAEGKNCLERIAIKPLPLEDDEVEILVSACGICGSDVHQLTDGWKSALYPLVPGHEFIGPVTAVGAGVTDIKVGDRVGVSPVRRSCGTCEECITGNGQLCPCKVLTYNSMYKGQPTAGGYTDKVRIQAAWAVKIPENISSKEGAPLLCAGVTTYLPFKQHNINENTSVGIVGIGGLGHLAIQWARAKKCKKILAISTTSRKRAEAFQLGATDFMALNDGVPSEHLASVDVLIVTGSGQSTSYEALLDLIKNHGWLHHLDLPDEPITLSARHFIRRHIKITGTFVGSNDDLKEMLEFASETGVRPWINEVGNSLDEVNRGLKLLMSGEARYRVVICGEGREEEK